MHIAVASLRKGEVRSAKYILKAISLLVHFGANPNLKNSDERTPLMIVEYVVLIPVIFQAPERLIRLFFYFLPPTLPLVQ